MRCYFHLINGPDIIRDTDGIEVDDVEEARTQALKAIQELRSNQEMADEDWQGWQLDVVDESGMLLFSVNLGRKVMR
jgi:hypothetical protein